jgi:hypothetical protein
MTVKKVLVKNLTTGVTTQETVNISELAGVTVTNPVTDEVMRFNGSEFVNGPGVATSAGKGVGWYYNGTLIIGTGNDNSNRVETISSVPWVATEKVEDTTVTDVGPVLADIYLYDVAVGRVTLEAGAWIFSCYAAVDATNGTTECLHNIMRVRPGTGTVTFTDGVDSTHKIVTSTDASAFLAATIDVGGTLDSDSFLRTPKGVYRITERTDNSHLIVLVPSTYTKEVTVAFSVHKRLFQVTTGDLNNTATSPLYAGIQLITIHSVQPAYTVLATDKVAVHRFAKTDSAVSKHLYFAYGGVTRYSRIDTPLATLHGDLAGKQGGLGSVPTEEYYHMSKAEYDIMHAVTTIGSNLIRLANPGAIAFPRFNADNTLSSLSAVDFRAAIGGTGNLLSPLADAEIAITTTATLTLGRMHVCSGTTSDYTATLPALSSSDRGFVGVRMAPALTKMVTIQGASATLIDGVNTRPMHNNETAFLHWDGAAWTKFMGKTIPMRGALVRSAGSATFAVNTWTALIKLNTSLYNHAPGAFQTPSTYRHTILRSGDYDLRLEFTTYIDNATPCSVLPGVYKNGVLLVANYDYALASSLTGGRTQRVGPLTIGDVLEPYGIYTGGLFGNNFLYDDSASPTCNCFMVEERFTW